MQAGRSVRLRPFASLATGDVRASLVGAYRCKSGWGCVDCAYRIQANDREVLHSCNLGFRREHQSGEVYMLTLTLPHRRGMRLQPMRKAVLRAYQRAHFGRRVKELRKRFGILATVRRLEVTDGPNSWHPHVHMLIFCDRKLVDHELESLREWYFVHFGVEIEKLGFERPKKAGMHACVADKDGQYLAKMGVLELAGDLQKKAKCSSCSALVETKWSDERRRCVSCGTEVNRNAWQIAADYHEHKSARDGRRFMQYRREIQGARRLTWSRFGLDLRKRYVDNQAELDVDKSHGHELHLTREAFDVVRNDVDKLADLLDAFEAGDRWGIEAVIGDHLLLRLPERWDRTNDPPRVVDDMPLTDNPERLFKMTLDEKRELAEARSRNPM